MADETVVQECIDDHLRRFRTYDRSVDVVSSFEALFTSSAELPPTISHFERFPTVIVRGEEKTPDFTVLFIDNTSLIGEIARIARNDQSVDSLCRQLESYEQAERVPAPVGGYQEVTRNDVVLLIPADVGPDAARRILVERVANTDHWYSPESPPCILQFLFDEERYMFQRLPTQGNGLPNDGSRESG